MLCLLPTLTSSLSLLSSSQFNSDELTTNFPLPRFSIFYVNCPAHTSPCKCSCVFTVSSSFVQASNYCSGKRAPDTGESVTSALLMPMLLYKMQTKQTLNEPTNHTPFYGVTDRANLLTNDWQMVVLCMTSYMFYFQFPQTLLTTRAQKTNWSEANSTYLDVIWGVNMKHVDCWVRLSNGL